MKTFNTIELEHLINHFSFLKGAEFQSVLGTIDVITLKLWDNGPVWITFNLTVNTPFVLAFEKENQLDPKFLKKALKKPLNIFLTTHFKGEKISEIKLLKSFGRVLRFYFGEGDDKYLEFRAYPGGLNLGAISNGKSVYYSKPAELEEKADDYVPEFVRTPSVLIDEGVSFLEGRVIKGDSNNADEKIKTAKLKIEKALIFLKSDGYKVFSEKLQNGESLDEDLKELYNNSKTDQENIIWGFEQQKLKDVKIERLEKRLAELVQKDAQRRNLKAIKGDVNNKKAASSLQATRFLQISEKLRAYCGKSAKENIGLLRKAKSWHIWMHLKDYPSGHLILEMPKNYEATEEDLKKCGLFLFKVAAPRKLHATSNVKFEVIFTESKFVNPLKGAKLGLVQPTRTKSRLYEWSKKDSVSY